MERDFTESMVEDSGVVLEGFEEHAAAHAEEKGRLNAAAMAHFEGPYIAVDDRLDAMEDRPAQLLTHESVAREGSACVGLLGRQLKTDAWGLRFDDPNIDGVEIDATTDDKGLLTEEVRPTLDAVLKTIMKGERNSIARTQIDPETHIGIMAHNLLMNTAEGAKSYGTVWMIRSARTRDGVAYSAAEIKAAGLLYRRLDSGLKSLIGTLNRMGRLDKTQTSTPRERPQFMDPRVLSSINLLADMYSKTLAGNTKALAREKTLTGEETYKPLVARLFGVEFALSHAELAELINTQSQNTIKVGEVLAKGLPSKDIMQIADPNWMGSRSTETEPGASVIHDALTAYLAKGLAYAQALLHAGKLYPGALADTKFHPQLKGRLSVEVLNSIAGRELLGHKEVDQPAVCKLFTDANDEGSIQTDDPCIASQMAATNLYEAVLLSTTAGYLLTHPNGNRANQQVALDGLLGKMTQRKGYLPFVALLGSIHKIARTPIFPGLNTETYDALSALDAKRKETVYKKNRI